MLSAEAVILLDMKILGTVFWFNMNNNSKIEKTIPFALRLQTFFCVCIKKSANLHLGSKGSDAISV